MTLQVRPLRWPRDHLLDWTDARERALWVDDLRDHVHNLFVLGHEGLKSPPSHGWSVKKIRRSLLINKENIDTLLYLAGAPREPWQSTRIPFWSPPDTIDPPEIATDWWTSPFGELPRHGWSSKQLAKCFGYMEGQLDYLLTVFLVTSPRPTDEQRRARWAVIRLKVLLEKLSIALGVAPERT